MQIYKFGATWCGPCKTLSRELEGLNLPIVHYDVDTEEAEPLIEKFGIRNVPVLVFVDKEGNELKKLVGAISKNKVLSTFEELQSSEESV